MMQRKFSIKQAVEATGLEESEIRFYERVFREFLTFSQLDLDKNEFSEDHVDLLRRIKELVHGKGMSLDEVKRQLKSALAPGSNGKSHGTNGHTNGAANGNGNGHAHAYDAQQPSGPFARKPKRLARVISITSGKGGVGKTTVTVNLAIAFAKLGKKVAIFDADLGLANVHILLGVKPKLNMRHVIEDNFKLDEAIVEGPMGIKLISGGQGVREMANLTADQRRVLLRQLDRLEKEVDILLIDTGAGISENVLRFATFADETIVVTTPNIAAAADGYSIIKILLEMEPQSKIGVVANQVASMYHSKNVFNRINAAAIKHLNTPLGDLGFIIEDPKVEAANQARKPLLMEHPDCEAAKNIMAIAETVLHGEVFRNQVKESSFEDLMGALKRSFAGV